MQECQADYKDSRMNRVETDDKGLVRTAWVLMRPRDSREKSFPYRSKKLVSLKVGIQRLVLICPADNGMINEVNQVTNV